MSVTPEDPPEPTDWFHAGQPAGFDGLEVVVWPKPSTFCQVTIVPEVTVSVVGLNKVFAMQILVAVGVHVPPPPPPPPPPPYEDVELPHDASITTPVTSSRTTSPDRIEPPSLLTQSPTTCIAHEYYPYKRKRVAGGRGVAAWDPSGAPAPACPRRAAVRASGSEPRTSRRTGETTRRTARSRRPRVRRSPVRRRH